MGNAGDSSVGPSHPGSHLPCNSLLSQILLIPVATSTPEHSAPPFHTRTARHGSQRSRSAINNCPSDVHSEAYDVLRVSHSRKPHPHPSVRRTSRNVHQAGGRAPSQDSQPLLTCRDCALSLHQERCNNTGVGHSWATICTAPTATVARSTSQATGVRMVPSRYR